MERLYLAVNPDGSEVVSNMSLFRAWEMMCKYSTSDYRLKHPLETYCDDQWMDVVEDSYYGYYGTDYSFAGTILPKGSIEKILGRTLTWDDEPMMIEFEDEKVQA